MRSPEAEELDSMLDMMCDLNYSPSKDWFDRLFDLAYEKENDIAKERAEILFKDKPDLVFALDRFRFQYDEDEINQEWKKLITSFDYFLTNFDYPRNIWVYVKEKGQLDQYFYKALDYLSELSKLKGYYENHKNQRSKSQDSKNIYLMWVIKFMIDSDRNDLAKKMAAYLIKKSDDMYSDKIMARYTIR